MLVLGVQQSDSVIHIFFFRFFSHVGYYRILSIVPCAVQQVLIVYLFYLSIIFYKFNYLFLAALGLRCCVRAFSSCSEQGLLFVAVRRLLTVVASLVAEHGL